MILEEALVSSERNESEHAHLYFNILPNLGRILVLAFSFMLKDYASYIDYFSILLFSAFQY